MNLTAALKNASARLRGLALEDGQDLVEYALLVALIVLVAVGAVASAGQAIYDVFWKGIGAASF